LIIKKKAQFYKREIDPALNIDDVIEGFGSKNGRTTQSTTTNTEVRHGPSSTSAPQRSSPSATSTTQPPTLADSALFLGHLFFIANVIISYQPFNPYAAHFGFVNSCFASLFVHGFRLAKRIGLPSIRTIQPWFQRAYSTTEFFYLLSTLVALNNPAARLTVVAAAITSVFYASAFLNSVLGHTALWQRTGAKPHYWLARNRDRALYLTAVLEIATFFQMVLGVFTHGLKVVMSTWMFLNQLKRRRWSPDTRFYHAAVWDEIGRRVQPITRAVPSLQRGLGWAERWFNQPGAQAQ